MLVEEDDRWVLPFRGSVVSEVRTGGAIELCLGDLGAVRIGGTAVLGWINVGDRPDRAQLDAAAGRLLVGVVVNSAVAFKSGTLRLAFGDGHLLRVEAEPDREAWTATVAGGPVFTSVPGGGISVSKR